MDSYCFLSNHFLIAMPGLRDPNFSRTVTYLCEHSAEGAMGLVINRPMSNIHLGDMLEQLDIEAVDPEAGRTTVYQGGPVQPDRGFVLHTGGRRWDSTLEITDKISITTSRDILESIAVGEGPENVLIALGYAGWASGQLENELGANSWLSGPAETDILFRLPAESRWQAAASLLRVDLNLLSGEAGHA
jgi:putative transcriptional regulator